MKEVINSNIKTPEEEELIIRQKDLIFKEEELRLKEKELESLRNELNKFEHKFFSTIGNRYNKIDEIAKHLWNFKAENKNKGIFKKIDFDRLYREQFEDMYREEFYRDCHSSQQDSNSKYNFTMKDDPNSEGFTDNMDEEDILENGKEKTLTSAELKKLYREIVKEIHPDKVQEEEEKELRTKLMMEINEAYKENDEEKLRSLYDNWKNTSVSVQGNVSSYELIRTMKNIYKIKEKIIVIDGQIDKLKKSDLYELKKLVDVQGKFGVDVIKNMCYDLDNEIMRGKKLLSLLNIFKEVAHRKDMKRFFK